MNQTPEAESLQQKNGESQTENSVEKPLRDHIETYGGHISSRHGSVHWWLAIVYLVLFIWSLYYGYTYWGGLGPGLDY